MRYLDLRAHVCSRGELMITHAAADIYDDEKERQAGFSPVRPSVRLSIRPDCVS